MGIAWQETGLAHRVRPVPNIPGTVGEDCYWCVSEPVSDDYADAGLCQGCGDHAAETADQARRELAYHHGLDATSSEPHVRWPFPTTRPEQP